MEGTGLSWVFFLRDGGGGGDVGVSFGSDLDTHLYSRDRGTLEVQFTSIHFTVWSGSSRLVRNFVSWILARKGSNCLFPTSRDNQMTIFFLRTVKFADRYRSATVQVQRALLICCYLSLFYSFRQRNAVSSSKDGGRRSCADREWS